MRYNRILMVTLLVLILLTPLSAIQAQGESRDDIYLSDVLSKLGPRGGEDLLFDILLYTIFFVGMVNTALIPEKQLLASMLNFLVLGMVVVSKLVVGTIENESVVEPDHLLTLPLHAGIFVVPLITAGMVRSHKGKASKAIIPAIFMGLLGGAYFFLFWSLQTRRCWPDGCP